MAPVFKFLQGDGPAAGVPVHYDAAAQQVTVQTPHSVMTWSVTAVLDDGTMELRRVLRPVTARDAFASDAQVASVDFRNKKGKMLDRQREEFGAAGSNAPAKPTAMDRIEQLQRFQDKMKRQREKRDGEIEAAVKKSENPDALQEMLDDIGIVESATDAVQQRPTKSGAKKKAREPGADALPGKKPRLN